MFHECRLIRKFLVFRLYRKTRTCHEIRSIRRCLMSLMYRVYQ